MNALAARIPRLFNIRPDEIRLTLLMLVYSAAIGIAINYFFTASSALFLSVFEITTLPYVFIAGGLAVFVTQAIYKAFEGRTSASGLLVGSLIALIIGLVGVRVALAASDARPLIFSLFVWFRVMIILLIIGFWGLANRLFDLGQSKRLFSLISAGDVLSIMIGSFLVPIIVPIIGTANLFVIVAGAVAICLGVVLTILREHPEQLATSEAGTAEARATQPRTTPRQLLADRYILLIFALYLLAWVFNYLLDFTFLERLQNEFADEPERIAGFIGLVFGFVHLTNFILKFFIVGRLLTRYGLIFGLLAAPIILTVGIWGTFGAGLLAGTAALFFWFVVVTKYGEEVLREATNEPATRILYQPIPPQRRTPALSFVEGTGYPLTAIIAGSILVVFDLTGGYSVLGTVGMLAVVAVAWVAMALLTYRAYRDQLGEALDKRIFTGEQDLVADPAKLALLRNTLKSPHPGQVIYALEMLEKLSGGQPPARYLADLLTHPAPEVRRHVLLLIEQHHPMLDPALVTILIEHEAEPSVRDAALRAYAALGADDVPARLVPYLDAVGNGQRGALIGLLRYGQDEAAERAERVLYALASHDDPPQRAFAANILGEIDNRRYASYLTNLLADPDPLVRRAALLATGRLNQPQYWPTVVKALVDHSVSTAAVSALLMANRSIYPTLEQVFNQPSYNRGLLVSVARICGQRGDEPAIALLQAQLSFQDPVVQHQVLVALHLCRFQATGAITPEIHRQIDDNIAQAAWLLAAQADLPNDALYSALRDALDTALEDIRARLLMLLAFLYDHAAMVRLSDNLRYGAREQRVYALESLSIMLARPLRARVLPLLDDLSPAEQLAQLAAHHPQTNLAPEDRLRDILRGHHARVNTWIIDCTVYTIAQAGAAHLYEDIRPLMYSFEPSVRQTAIWALWTLDPERLRSDTAHMLADDGLPQSGLAQQIQRLTQTENPMLLTIEKVLILKTVGIFQQVPDNILVEIAALLDEVRLSPGETLFQEGEAGSAMYIIVSGVVRIQTEKTVVAERKTREFIGEMSLFDGAPRSATAVAQEETHLLRLSQGAFRELLANHADMALGIIRVLSERLREAMQTRGISPMMAQLLDRIEAD